MTIEQLNKSHYDELLNLKLKAEDLNETLKITGFKTSKQALELIINSNSDDIYVIKYKDKISGVFGVIPESNNMGLGILLTDDNIIHYKKSLIKNTTITVNYFLEIYEIIYNFCPKRYTKSLLWLERICGAHVEDEEFVINGEIFKRFFISKDTRR